MPKVRPSGSRSSTYEAFCDAVVSLPHHVTPILLVDSEQKVLPSDLDNPLDFLRRHGMPPVKGTTVEQYQLMVRCMETWLVADLDALRKFFSNQNFDPGKLPQHANLETVSPTEMEEQLRAATRRVPSKRYHKGRHAFKILGNVDPNLVGKALPWANRFQQTLLRIC